MTRHRKLVVDELLTKPSAVAPMLFVGIGGCGCRMVARVARHLHRRPDWKERYSNLIKFALLDTNINDLEAEREIADETFLISDFEKEEYANLAAGKSFLEADPYFTQWVPKNYRFRAGDTAGAGQIRIESRLGLFYQIKHKDFLPRFRQLLDDLKAHELGHRRLDSQELRIVLCYSVAGGTGSGCHLPLAYVLRDMAREVGKPRLFGVAVMPAVFQDKTGINKDGTFANGYAALKETEHLMKLGAPDSRFYPEDGYVFHYNPADESKRLVRDKPFEFVYLVDKPQSFSVSDVVDAAADGLCLQFFSPLYARQASDYDNYTQHQRFLVPHDFEGKGILGFTTFYGSYGAAVLLVPVPGLVEYCAQAAALSLMQQSFLRGVPSDPTYSGLRADERFNEVTEGDGKNEKPIHRSEFHKKMPNVRGMLRDRLFMKRVRLLAACERSEGVEKRFLPLFRHGQRLGEVPTRDGGFEFREDQAGADRKLLANHGMEHSIGAVALEALAGTRPGELPGLMRAAREAIEDAVDDLRPTPRDGTVGEFLNAARPMVDDLYNVGRRLLEDGYKRGAVAYPGLGSLVDLDFLSEEAAAVELAAKRYAVLSILAQVKWEQLPPERSEFELRDVNEGDKVKRKGGEAKALIDKLADQAVDQAMERVGRHFVERLGDLKQSLGGFRNVQRTLDFGFEELEREAKRRLDVLRLQGEESSNQYVLDAEALQIEDGRRMWDYFYEDKVTPLQELTLRDKRVQQVLSDTVADLALGERGGDAVGQTNSATLDRLFTDLRKHAAGVLERRIGGDPHSADRERREGLTLSEALELEVIYRALHRSNAEDVERDGLKAVRGLVAEYRALPTERRIDVGDTLHQDYLRDKIKRVVKEKASRLCVYEESRDQHGGVRPDDVFLAAIDEDFRNGTIADALRKTDIADLEWVTEGWHNPKEIIFYRAILNVPLYVFGRLKEMKHDYHRFRNLAKRPKVLHIDSNWENDLADLDPDSSQEKHRQRLVREQIVNFSALLRILSSDHPGAPHCVVRRDAKFYLCAPETRDLPLDGEDGKSGHLVLLGTSMSEAIERLPDVLEAEPVKYLPYQQTLRAVRQGMSPEVLRRITRLPFEWRRNRDELKQQYGPNASLGQRERLKDYTDSYLRLEESLGALHDRLSNREIEHRTLGEVETPIDGVPEEPTKNLLQSLSFLRAFRETWTLLESPEKGGRIHDYFRDLFLPLGGDELNAALDRLRNAFGGFGETPPPANQPDGASAKKNDDPQSAERSDRKAKRQASS